MRQQDITCPAFPTKEYWSTSLFDVVAFATVWPQEMGVWQRPKRGKESNPTTTESQSVQKGRRDERAENCVRGEIIRNDGDRVVIFVGLSIASIKTSDFLSLWFVRRAHFVESDKRLLTTSSLAAGRHVSHQGAVWRPAKRAVFILLFISISDSRNGASGLRFGPLLEDG
jgi:hypothetical protein